MGNQGKIARTQSSTKYLFLLTFRLSYLRRNFSTFSSLRKAIGLSFSLLITVNETLFLWRERVTFDEIIRF